MTEQEKQEIISAVLSAIRTNSKTIDQLTPVSEMSDDDFLELNGGRRVSYANFMAVLDNYITGEGMTEYDTTLAKLGSTKKTLNWRHSPIVLLDSMGTTLDRVNGDDDYSYTAQTGDLYTGTSGDKIFIFEKSENGATGERALEHVLYINKHTLRMYLYNHDDDEFTELTTDYLDNIGISNMAQTSVANIPVGRTHYLPSMHRLVYRKDANTTYTWTPRTDLIYVDMSNNSLYRWNGSSFQRILGASDNVDVIDNLDTNDGTKALSAKQGKILRANVEVLNANINALSDALANIAFTSTPKPAMSELDWGGDKCAVAVNNSLTGCTANKSGTQQVSEGSDLVITITADNGNLLRSVTASAGTVVIAANRESATVTLAMVQADMSINITATATAKGSFAASINDGRVDGTGATNGITEGSAWSSVLSLNGTAGDGAAITAISASMEGGGTITVNGSTVSTEYVTGNITIVVTVVVPARVTITFPAKSTGVVITDNDNNDAVINDGVTFKSIAEGGSINWKIAADEWFTIQAVNVQGGTVTDNGNGTYAIVISNITTDVAISASATSANVAFKGVRISPIGNGNAYLAAGAVYEDENEGYMIGPLIDLGETRTETVTMVFNTVEGGIAMYNSNLVYIDYYMQSVPDRTVTVSTAARYIRLYSKLNGATASGAAYVTVDGVLKFDASQLDIAAMKGWSDFIAPFANDNGDYLNWVFRSSGSLDVTIGSNARTDKNAVMCTGIGGLTCGIGISRIINLPEAVNGYRKIKFAAGAKYTKSTDPHIEVDAEAERSFYSADAYPRTINNIAEKWVTARVVFNVADYNDTAKDLYVKDNTDSNNPTNIWVIRDNNT